jgi:hypothetical protein
MTKDAFEKFVVNVFALTPLKPDADRNEMNLKEAPYGTSYQNSKGEVSYIRPHHDGTYSIIHKGIKLDYSFKSYVEAERFLKRKDYSWLRFDQDCLKDLAGSIPITMDELKENYINIITDILEKSE